MVQDNRNTEELWDLFRSLLILKRSEYKSADNNVQKNEVVAKFIEEWRQKNGGRFIRHYNGRHYAASDTLLKVVVRRFLLRKEAPTAAGESTPKQSSAAIPRGHASRAKANHLGQPTLQAHPEMPTEPNEIENDLDEEASPSVTEDLRATFEVLLEDVKRTPFLSRYAAIVEHVVKRQTAPNVDSKPKASKRKAAPQSSLSQDQNSEASPPANETKYVDVTSPPRPQNRRKRAVGEKITPSPRVDPLSMPQNEGDDFDNLDYLSLPLWDETSSPDEINHRF